MLPLPLRTDTPLRSRPWTNWLLIVTNVVVFLAEKKMPNVSEHFRLNARDPHLRQFFTYAFLHLNWIHLLGNLLPLYIFGNNVNDRLGHIGYLAFYLAGAVFAGSAFVLTQAGGSVLGASGAVGAVMGAYLVLFPRSNITLLSLFIVVLPSMYFIVVFFLFNLAMSFMPTSSIAYVAHIGGMLFGFAVAMFLLALHLLPRNQWDMLALIQRWDRRRKYRALVKEGFNPFEKVPPKPAPRADDVAERDTNGPDLLRITALRERISQSHTARNVPVAAALYLELKQLDATQILPRPVQLDVANQLFADNLYPNAAQAYEDFLATYVNYDQMEQVHLMLGLLYARYLNAPEKARRSLNKAIADLHTPRELALARDELAKLPAN